MPILLLPEFHLMPTRVEVRVLGRETVYAVIRQGADDTQVQVCRCHVEIKLEEEGIA